MSAIAGIYYLDQRTVDRTDLARMVDILAHRGPDSSNIWSEESIGLGHRMLWTTPESLLEKLPLVNQSSELAITADARIDNRDELIAALNLTDCPAEKIPDSELILAAYEKWGESCPEQLLGDFVFAIWDGRKQKLFCARDPMGIKPFYYYRSGRVFAFASEIKALLCLPEMPRRLNEVKVAYHLRLFCEDQISTFYQDILRLPAAQSLTISCEKMQIQSYWSLDPCREVRLNSHEEYAEAFREIFTEAVRCRLRSAFPIGSTLSGGLDSSSVACISRQLLAQSGNQKLHTFSAIFPSLPNEELRLIDERIYMDAVHAIGGFEPHYVQADQLSPLIKLLWQEDEPGIAPNMYIHQALYNCANQQGVRVFLDGFDGDSTISHGWLYLTELLYKGRWQTLMTEVNAVARQYRLSRKRVLWQYSMKPLVSELGTYLWQKLGKGTQIDALPDTMISPAFAQQVRLAERTQKLLSNKPNLTLTTKQSHCLSLTSGLYPYALELADKSTARFSLEARYPFFDRRLMEFCLALPSSQKFRQGWSRMILRSAMTNILPPEVQWRVNKSNLSPNFNRRLLESERKTIEAVINQPQVIQPYVNLPALRAAYDRYASQPQERGQDAISILSPITLALWLHQLNLRLQVN